MNIGLMASKYESLFDEYVDELELPDFISFIASYYVPDSEDDIREMFEECTSLVSLPDISKFVNNNIDKKKFPLNECLSLIFIPKNK